MVTVRTRKLWTCLPGKPRWIAGWQQTSAGTRQLFLADQSSHPSSTLRFAPEIPGHWHSWGQVFLSPLERNRGSRWDSSTSLSLWQLSLSGTGIQFPIVITDHATLFIIYRFKFIDLLFFKVQDTQFPMDEILILFIFIPFGFLFSVFSMFSPLVWHIVELHCWQLCHVKSHRCDDDDDDIH